MYVKKLSSVNPANQLPFANALPTINLCLLKELGSAQILKVVHYFVKYHCINNYYGIYAFS